MFHSKVLIFTFLLMGFMATSASAQPVITDNEFPSDIGLNQKTIGGVLYDFGSPVPGTSPWNLSTGPDADTNSTTFINKTGLPFADSFPSATIALRDDDPVMTSYTFASKSSSNILVYGYSDDSTVIVYTNPWRFLEFPLSMGDSWSDTVSFTIFGFPFNYYFDNRVIAWGNLTVPAFPNLPALVLRRQQISDFLGMSDTTYEYCWIVENWGISAEASVDTNDTTTSIADNLDRLWTSQVGVEEGSDFRFPISDLRLEQNQPNPFHSSTIIRFTLPTPGFVTLSIYDLTGRLVETLVEGVRSSGVYAVSWEGNKNPVGLYFARLSQGDQTSTKKIILLR